MSLETLKPPHNQGGLDILDIRSRNKVIEVMWIKELLSEEKSTWRYFAHDMIAHQGTKVEINIPKEVKSNIFLQSFNIKKSMLPLDLQRILNVAKKTGVRVKGIAFSRDILRSRPIWYHSEANPRIRLLTCLSASLCLRENHNLQTVREAEELSLLLDDPNHMITNRVNRCICYICEAMIENMGCRNPNECMCCTKDLLDMLLRKWDPCYMLLEDYKEAPKQLEVGIEFDRCVTTHGPVTNAFRIFTEGRVSNVLPDLRIAAPTTIVKVATSGAYQEITSTNESRAGAGVFTAEENGLERALKVLQSLRQSNQVGGVLAAKILADSVNPRYTLHNDTNLKHLLRHLILSWELMEDNGYIGIPDKDILQSMIASYRRRKQISTVNWVIWKV